MKQDEKSALSRQKIVSAAMQEFSRNGYKCASLNSVWAQEHISKGMIYHHFKDKDELYLLCAGQCFSALIEYIRSSLVNWSGTSREKLKAYFDARFRFFAENPVYLGLFVDASFDTPAHLREKIACIREEFDSLNASILEGILESESLRDGLEVRQAVDDLRSYMDYFNLQFRMSDASPGDPSERLKAHERMCHRLIDIWLYGVIERKEE